MIYVVLPVTRNRKLSMKIEMEVSSQHVIEKMIDFLENETD